MDSATFIQLLGALGLGSVLGQYISGRTDRRKARADVLEHLGICESSRWAPLVDGEPHFGRAGRNLQSSALLAGLPAEAVRVYLVIGQAAAWESAEAHERYQDPEGGGISAEHAKVVEEAATMVAALVWRPWRSRILLGRRLDALMRKARALPQFGPQLSASERIWVRTA